MGFLPSNITALRKQEQLLSSAYTYIYVVAIDVVDADASGVADADAGFVADAERTTVP